MMSEHPIDDEISIILVSISQGRVIDEYIVPLKDGRIPKFSCCAVNYFCCLVLLFYFCALFIMPARSNRRSLFSGVREFHC